MTLVFFNGCEDFTGWSSTSGVSIVTGRTQSGIQSVGVNSGLTKQVAVAQESATITVGCAVKTVTIGNEAFLTLRSDGGATTHLEFRIRADGSFDSVLGGASFIDNLPAGTLPTGQWFYFEVQAVLHDTTGSIICQKDGVEFYRKTGTDTKYGGTKTVFDSFKLQTSTGAGATVIFDDVYCLTGTDSFYGDCVVETLYPDGNGSANDWVGSDSDSMNNYLLVDEAGTPVTTDYVASNTTGQQDLYTLTNLTRTTGTVKAVAPAAWMANDDSGVRAVKLAIRPTTTTYTATATNLSASYANYDTMYLTNPDGGAWTITQVNALQAGVECG